MMKSKNMIPPIERLPPYARRGNYQEMGQAFLETAIRLGGLESHHRVLDVGCGVGRFAVALADFLDVGASYDGLDANRRAIRICNEYIGSKDHRFCFQLVDAFNSMYSPESKTKASKYRFPFDDEYFDFVFSNSLFTHLLPPDTENYYREIVRTLKPGGRTLNTMFLLNSESLEGIRSGTSDLELPYRLHDGICRVKRLEKPEAAVAYDEVYMCELHKRVGLEVMQPIRYGAWSGRESTGSAFGNKDIVVAIKR